MALVTTITICQMFLLLCGHLVNCDPSTEPRMPLTSRTVRTKYGDVSGVIVTLEARHLEPVEVFRGIPYASPPLGSLRFMPPVTGALWAGVKIADRFSPVCPQRLPDIANETAALKRMPKGRLEYLKRLLPYLQDQNEDCLYLNVYAPVQGSIRYVWYGRKAEEKHTYSNVLWLKTYCIRRSGKILMTNNILPPFITGTREGTTSSKFPVVVFIHGESYEWNSGNPYDGSVFASYGGVVVVTVNYRLGILGFLNANTDPYSRSPANYGLMDQIAALHWLQENIAVFGGDPTNVTVIGHGTGAACVNFLLTSSAVPEGVLFHRAILMSGSALSPWALVQDPSRYAAQVAIHANCSPELPHLHLLQCLREKPLELLMSTPVIVPEFTFAFGPSVDGVVIDTEEPPDGAHNDFDSGKAKRVQPQNNINLADNVLLRKSVVTKLSRYDLMLGVVKAEAYFAFNAEDVQYGIEADRRSKILRTFVRNTYSYHLSEILATIVNEYTDWERPVQHPINIRDETLEALSDAQYVAPVVHTADLHSAEHRNSYLYVYDYQTKTGDYPQRQGCIHGDELPYLFGAPLVAGFMHFGRNYTKSEILLSETTMIYWSNFARSGNPNEADADVPFGNRLERSKLKNIEWTAYEAVHKKYLNLDTKPKLKNHYRAHRLSFWLNLVPDLHKSGGDDIPDSHHQLKNDEPPPKLPSLNPRKVPTVDPLGTTNPIATNTTVGTSEASDSAERVEELGSGSTTPHTLEDGFAAYSTALSVTIAIGCSLLILNVLIFAGVYYQRDKTRMNEHNGPPKKRNENGQMPNNICGDLESSIIGVKSEPATILGHHHHSHHQLPPPEFADLPQNHATLPRPPPPPKTVKINSHENQPLLHAQSIQLMNTGTLTKKNTQLNSGKSNAMEELRV